MAQHLLAKEIVELAHGAAEASKAEIAHRDAFSDGTHTFPLGALRRALSREEHKEFPASKPNAESPRSDRASEILAYKMRFVANSGSQASTHNAVEISKNDQSNNIMTLPRTLLHPGSFPRVLHAAGLVSSRSEGRRLILSKGAYIVLPNSGSIENSHGLKWEQIPDPVSALDPSHYLIDDEALVIRSGKSKIQICRIISERQFEDEGLSCPGWEDFKAKEAEQEPVKRDR